MEHRILKRYPIGNARRHWKQDTFVLSTFAARGTCMRDVIETCADAGFNLLELGWASHTQAEEALRLCEERGIRLLYQDFSAFGGMQGRHLENSLVRGRGDVRRVTEHIRPWNCAAGYYVWDEPYREAELREARRMMDFFEQEDPARLPFIVAIPSYNDLYRWENGQFADYLRRFVTIIDPPVLSLDYYPVGLPGYTDEKQLDNSLMWCDLDLLRKLGRERGLPFWFYYQAVNLHGYHRFTFPMVRMMMYAAAMYGAKGLQQFTAVGSVMTESGQREVFFEEQKQIHAEFAALGRTLMALDNQYVFHSDDLLPDCVYEAGRGDRIADSAVLCGTLPTRTSAGEFTDGCGNVYLLILNRDFERPADIMLSLRGKKRLYEVSRTTGRQEMLCGETDTIEVTLAAGDAVLYRVQPAEEEAFTIEYRIEKNEI